MREEVTELQWGLHSLAEEELHHTDLTGRFRPTVHFSSHISLVTVQIHRFV